MELIMFFAAALLACSTSAELSEPPPSPPIAAGVVCVEATPSDATVMVGGKVATERCTQVEQTYTSEVEVVVSAPGHKAHTTTAALVGGEEVVTVTLEPAP